MEPDQLIDPYLTRPDLLVLQTLLSEDNSNRGTYSLFILDGFFR